MSLAAGGSDSFMDELERKFSDQINHSKSQLDQLRREQIEQYRELLDPEVIASRQEMLETFLKHLQGTVLTKTDEIASRLESAFSWSSDSILWNHREHKEIAELVPLMIRQITDYTTAASNSSDSSTDGCDTATIQQFHDRLNLMIQRASHMHRQL